MARHSQNLLIIAVISLCFGFVYSEVKFNILKLCSCYQLFYQSECESFSHCQYSDSYCELKPCRSLRTQQDCYLNSQCGWYKNKCSDFKSCSEYGIEDSYTCNNLHQTCVFNPYNETCARYDDAYQLNCSSTPRDECYFGADGVCIYENGQCQQLQSCSDANYSNLTCNFASPACYFNIDKICQSQIGCENAQRFNCEFAPVGINSHQYYLCQEGNNGTCIDFDITSQTKDTCFYDTYGYYHWTGSACEACKSQILLVIVSFILLIVV